MIPATDSVGGLVENEIKTPEGIRRILVIDDEAVPRQLLAVVLGDAGYDVTTLGKPDDVDLAMRSKTYELVITDLRMPVMDGMQVMHFVREHYPSALVMMVTAVTETETAVEAMKTGAVDYLTKPLNADAVLMSVQRADQVYRLQKENQSYREGLEALVEQRTAQIYRFADALSLKNQMILKANRELHDANEKLQQFLNHAMVMDKVSTIGLLSSMLIHGIANPLGVVSGIAEVMQKRFAADSVTTKELVMMQNYLKQVLDLVNQIRSYAKTEVVQFEAVDVGDSIRNAVTMFQLLLRRKDIRLETELPDHALWISGNPSQLEQVLANLIQNAIHAIEKDGVIRITAGADGNEVRVNITDNGSGIPDEHQKRLFKMFFTTKEDGRGTGLGLFICNEIVAKHKGKIDLESEVGKGTTVTLTFPQQAVAEN